MARADSTVRVNVIGDARSLNKAMDQSASSTDKLAAGARGLGGAIVAAFATDKVFDFAQSALSEFDRVGDATARLEEQLGTLADPILASADSLHALGLSRQDVLELGADFADLATSAGVADDKIAGATVRVAEAGAAIALLTDKDAASVIDAIGKAAGGSERQLRELGINMTDAEVAARAMRDTGKGSAEALTENELAAARLDLILEKLAPRIDSVTQGTADLEQRQSELSARWETFTGQVGESVEGPLNDFLGWLLAGMDGLAGMEDALPNLSAALFKVHGPLATLTDGFSALVDVISEALRLIGQFDATKIDGRGSGAGGGFGSSSASGGGGGGGAPGAGVTVQVQGGSPEEIQQAVYAAIRRLNAQGTALDY